MVDVRGQTATFEFFRPEAGEVFLAGDFNHWQERQIFLRRTEAGLWRVRLMLRPGRYEFRYCADGEWYTDFGACGLEPGRFGLNSVLLIPEHRSCVLEESGRPLTLWNLGGGGNSIKPLEALNECRN